jgi:exo-beta-1,3-glucanase (GH17 family)
MKSNLKISIMVLVLTFGLGCDFKKDKKVIKEKMTAAKILGNPNYIAISYGGYRQKSRDIQPTIAEIKDDMKILFAMGIRIVRTYNIQLQQAPNLLKAIRELKKEDPTFEMYVMLGAWIDCLNAWTEKTPDHTIESAQNEKEIDRAVFLAKKYPDIVKVVAVGNEAMVRWAASYYVQPNVILKWVTHLQDLKKSAALSADLWITSSDDFASWGGGDPSYRTPDLEKLIKAVDYVSMHTYPYHNTHYNPNFWRVPASENGLSEIEKVDAAMLRAKKFATDQFYEVQKYVDSIAKDKPVHIGETGWATYSNGHYSDDGSKASDEYKEALYHKYLREWSIENKVSCFYFEAFDEQWKDAKNPKGSENHFGLINLKSEAKFALWDFVDNDAFKGLTRDGKPITKTFKGNKKTLMGYVKSPR